MLKDENLIGLAMVSGITINADTIDINALKKFEAGIGIRIMKDLSNQWDAWKNREIELISERGGQVSEEKVGLVNKFIINIDEHAAMYDNIFTTLSTLKNVEENN